MSALIPPEKMRSQLGVIGFRPTNATWIAVATVPPMWAVYYTNTRWMDSHHIWALLIYFVVGNIVLATLIPALVVRCDGGLARLGFTQQRLQWAAGLSLLLGVGSAPQAFKLAAEAGADVWPHLAYNGLILWEPLFVYGWLQLRFRDAFGWLPAPILSAIAFGLYHVGSVPITSALGFVGIGLVFGIIFTLVPNMLVLFPLTWAVSSAIGTLQSGLAFGWDVVVIGAVVLIIQVVILVTVGQTGRRGRSGKSASRRARPSPDAS